MKLMPAAYKRLQNRRRNASQNHSYQKNKGQDVLDRQKAPVKASDVQ